MAKEYCKCSCTNELLYSNCDKNCERVQAELNDSPPDELERGWTINNAPDELDKEAQSLIEKFQDELRGALYSPHNNAAAKQCAIIHCNLMHDKLTELLKSGLHNDFGIMAERGKYTTIKQKIEQL